MKHTLKIPHKGLFIITTQGIGTVEGINAFLTEIISHPKWHPGDNILVDHRALDLSGIQSSGIEAVSVYFISIAHKMGNGRLAIVLARDIDFGIARAWELITEHDVEMAIHVFRNMAEAEKWLTKG